jgi:CRISPR/Cas system CMR-associated protein Cmr5 small subunit
VLELSKSLDKEKKINCSESSKYSCLPVLKKYYFLTDSDILFSKYFIPNVSGGILKKFKSIEPRNINTGENKSIDLFEYRKEQPQLMAERFKEEFTVTFFLGIKKDFENYTELKAIFPEVAEIIKYIDANNVYNIFPIFRDAVERDMEKMLIHLSRFRLQSNYYESLKSDKGKIFSFISTLASGLQQGRNLADIISDLAEEQSFIKDSTNLFQAARFMNLISSCFRDTVDGRMWINANQFKNLIESDTKLKILFGLIYQKNLQINVCFRRNNKTSLDLKNELEEVSQNYKSNHSHWSEYLIQVYNAAIKVEAEYDTLNKLTKNPLETANINYKRYSFSVQSYINSVLNVDIADETIILPDEIKACIPFIYQINEAFSDYNTKRYGRAVFKTIQILDSTLFYDNRNKDSRDKLIRYSIFFANLAEAKTPEDIRLAIDAEISPVKASSLKDYSNFSISINAYFGICGGMEYLKINKNKISTLGLSIPIGIGIYKNTPKCKKIIGHIGIYCSVIDLGVPASFRLSGDSTSRLPEMKIQNIIAPGVCLVAGRLFNSSFSLGAGLQYGPQSRMIVIKGIPAEASSWRWNISLSYDLPLVYLFKK